MVNKILFNDQEFDSESLNYPVLIHGVEGSGASTFTVSLAANLYKKGKKLLFLCGFPMAGAEFSHQIEKPINFILHDYLMSPEAASQDPSIFILRDNKDSFLSFLDKLPDINERVVILRNVSLFDKQVLDKVKQQKNYIISGDLEESPLKQDILSTNFSTKIFFSDLEPVFNRGNDFEKYYGKFESGETIGKINTQILNPQA